MPFLMTDYYAPQAMQANIANVQSETALRGQQVQEGQLKIQQQQAMQQAMQEIAKGGSPASMQQQGAGGGVSTDSSTQQSSAPSTSDSLTRVGSMQLNMANALIAKGIPQGMEMAKEASKTIYDANLIKQQELENQIKQVKDTGNILSNVTDQESYTMARDEMLRRHPDAVKNDKLGPIYTPEVAKQVKFFSDSVNTHAENLANQKAMLDIGNKAKDDQSKLEHQQAQTDEVKARTTVLREGLKTPKVKADPAWVAHDKAVAAIEKVNNNPMLSDEVKAKNIAGIQQNYHEALRGLGRTTIGKSANITPPTKAEAQTPPQEGKTKVSSGKINTPTQVKTEADYAALPAGATYKDPNGVLRRKGMQ